MDMLVGLGCLRTSVAVAQNRKYYINPGAEFTTGTDSSVGRALVMIADDAGSIPAQSTIFHDIPTMSTDKNVVKITEIVQDSKNGSDSKDNSERKEVVSKDKNITPLIMSSSSLLSLSTNIGLCCWFSALVGPRAT